MIVNVRNKGASDITFQLQLPKKKKLVAKVPWHRRGNIMPSFSPLDFLISIL